MKYLLLLCLSALCFGSCDRGKNQSLKAQPQLQAAYDAEKALKLRQEGFELAQPGNPFIKGDLSAADGSIIFTESLRGKVVVMDFWASWCAPCIERIPHFFETAKKYDPDKVAFLLVNVDAEKAHWQKFVEEKDWTKNCYWVGDEGSNNPLFSYGLSKMPVEGDSNAVLLTLPKHVLINKAGNTAFNFIPGMENSDLEGLIASLLTGQ